jgi:hypothetical protein
MVSWHRALYRAFFRVPWRALVPVPPSHAPQLSNLYLQSAGGRVALGQSGTACDLPPRLCPASLPSTCTPPHLRIPSSSCKAPCTGCAESGLHRCPRGSPRRSPCCWGCRVHSAHSLPGPPFFTLSATRGEQSSGRGVLGDALRNRLPGVSSGAQAARSQVPCPSPILLQPPSPSITFLLGHRGGKRQEGEKGEEEEASVLHPGECGGRRARVKSPSPVPFLTGGRV